MTAAKHDAPPQKKPMTTYFELPLKKANKNPEGLDVLIKKRDNSKYKWYTGEEFVEKYNQFIKEVNLNILELNKRIKQYNQLSDPHERIEHLKSIYHFQRYVLKQYPDQMIQNCPGFKSKFHEGLFRQIQSQAKDLGISSMHYFETAYRHLPQSLSSIQFREILSDMEPQKAEKLLQILIQASKLTEYKDSNPKDKVGYLQLKNTLYQEINVEFKHLFAKDEEHYKAFIRFLKNFEDIQFIGGFNSLNFKISLKNSSPAFVLKVENRRGNPGTAEDYLRRQDDLREVFTPLFAERQVTAEVGGQYTTRSLMITEYCTDGDLKDFSDTLNDIERSLCAQGIFLQMALILERFKKHGCGHSDLKLENFLFKNNTLRIADTKAIVFLTDGKYFDQGEMYKEWYYLITTPHICPPEFGNMRFLADKSAAYMFGKNLYQFLSRCEDDYLLNNHEGKKYDFRQAIFNSPEGEIYKFLIKDLIKPNPSERMSIYEALIVLKDMNLELSMAKYRCWEQLDLLLTSSNNQEHYAQYKAEIATANLRTIKNIELKLKQIEEQQHRILVQRQADCRQFLHEVFPDKQHFNYIWYDKMIGAARLDDLSKVYAKLDREKIKQEQALQNGQESCRNYLDEIKIACSYAKKDQGMKDFVRRYDYKINAANAITIETIKSKLLAVYADVVPIKEELLKATAGLSKKLLAHKINTLMTRVAVENRGKNLMQLSYPQGIEDVQWLLTKDKSPRFFNSKKETPAGSAPLRMVL